MASTGGAVWGEGALADALRDALADAGDPAGVVVVVDTAFAPDALVRANRRLRARGATGLPVYAAWDAVTVGPLLRPDRPGCYQCLATRMRMARAGGPAADRELWQRFASGALAPPAPVLVAPLLAMVAALVADECTRLATGQPVRTQGAVLRVGAAGLSVQRHPFLPYPACDVCGAVPDDAPALAAVTLQPRPKADPAGDRTGATPDRAALVERFVDARTGLIHSVQVEYSGTTVNASAVIHADAAVPGSAGDWLAEGGARTLDRESSVAVAILETLERYAGLTADLGKRTVVRASYRDLPEADAIDPRTLGLPPPDQLADGYVPYHPELPLPWVWGWSFGRARPVLVPEPIGYYYRRPGPHIAYECSNGCALGSCREEAILHGLLEVVERDGFLITWYARLPVPRIDWRTVADPVTRLLAARLEGATGDRLHLLDTTMPEGVPSIAALVVDERDRPGYAKAFLGGGAHLDPERAIRRAVQEVALSDGQNRLSPTQVAQAQAMLADADLVTELDHHGWLYCLPAAWPRLAFLLDGALHPVDEAFPPAGRYAPSGDLTDDLRHLLDRYLRGGLDVVVVDQTIPEQRDAGLACVKVVVPGTLPMTFGHRHRRAAGVARLHTMPVRLGYRAAPLPVAEINPYPHPFP